MKHCNLIYPVVFNVCIVFYFIFISFHFKNKNLFYSFRTFKLFKKKELNEGCSILTFFLEIKFSFFFFLKENY